MTDLFDIPATGRTAAEAQAREIPGLKSKAGGDAPGAERITAVYGGRAGGGMTDAATLARGTDPDTSHEAAGSISPRLRELQALVLDFAAGAPDGFTDVAMNRHFDTHGSTYRTRRSELVAKGYIRDTGERHAYGKDGTGRRHVIWQITLEGLKAHGEAIDEAEAKSPI